MILKETLFSGTLFKKRLLLTVFVLCNLANAMQLPAQEKAVVLVEEKLPKRTLLFAKNNSNEEKNIFLKVNPTGYRRSSSRPIIKTIPAQSKVEMITLIPLKDTEASYTYTLIINEQDEAVTVDYSQGEKKQADVADIMDNELVIFTKDNCEQCEKLTEMLHGEQVKFRAINVNDRDRFYDYFWNRLEQDGFTKDKIALPVVVDKGKLRYPITNLKSLVEELAARKL